MTPAEKVVEGTPVEKIEETHVEGAAVEGAAVEGAAVASCTEETLVQTCE